MYEYVVIFVRMSISRVPGPSFRRRSRTSSRPHHSFLICLICAVRGQLRKPSSFILRPLPERETPGFKCPGHCKHSFSYMRVSLSQRLFLSDLLFWSELTVAARVSYGFAISGCEASRIRNPLAVTVCCFRLCRTISSVTEPQMWLVTFFIHWIMPTLIWKQRVDFVVFVWHVWVFGVCVCVLFVNWLCCQLSELFPAGQVTWAGVARPPIWHQHMHTHTHTHTTCDFSQYCSDWAKFFSIGRNLCYSLQRHFIKD